ncbi:MAG: hypothetical protein NTV00_16340 [Methylococcales bacterium]|jgi:hypothetical protein|nr:hypothetical protein [Methylococcales bacterium]
MGGVTSLFLIMFLIAGFAFAPLGYFIYKFTQENAKPFGETEPHGDSESWILDLVDKVIHKAKEIIQKK